MRTLSVAAGVVGSVLACPALAADSDRDYAAELKADAAARAGAGNGLASLADDASAVKLGGWAQFRYIMNFRDDPGEGIPHDSGFTNGFETTRTRLNATGNIVSKDLTFKLEAEFSKSTGVFGLLDAYVDYAYGNGVSARAGQFKPPLLREELVSDTYQLLVNRGLVNEVFTQKRSQGIQGQYRAESWTGRLSLNDGLSNLNTEYTDPKESDIAVTGRVDFKGSGDWKRFDDFTSWQGSDTTWLIGLAAHWQHDGNTASTGSPLPRQLIEYTADFSIEGNGWNGFAAFVGRHIDPDAGGGPTLDDFGGQIQAGVFVAKQVELFGAWDGVFPDGNYGTGHDKDVHAFTLGANYYLFEKTHAAKFTGEAIWYANEISESAPVNALAGSNNIGLRPSSHDSQLAVLLQFQFIF